MKTKLVASTLEALKIKLQRQIVHDKKQPIREIDPLTEKPVKSKGQLFKEKWGFSKTFKRNMQKAGLNPFAEEDRIIYRAQRNKK